MRGVFKAVINIEAKLPFVLTCITNSWLDLTSVYDKLWTTWLFFIKVRNKFIFFHLGENNLSCWIERKLCRRGGKKAAVAR